MMSCPGSCFDKAKKSTLETGDLDWEILNMVPWIPRVPDVVPRLINRSVSTDWGGQRTLCRPTVAKPMTAHKMLIMKHKAIFSLHACCTALSLRPPTELKRKVGAQNVTTREKIAHASKLNDDDSAT